MTTAPPRKSSTKLVPGPTEALHSLALRPAGLNDAEVDVFRQLLAAISDRRLTPGLKLTEEELATIFKVSRERVRRVLLVLSQQGIISLEPNRGASVAQLSAPQRRDAFETRRVLEVHVVRELAQMSIARRKEICGQLEDHLKKEQTANGERDRNLQIRLSGEFHLLLAAYGGNKQILRVLQELQALTALAMAAHPHPYDQDCSLSEHQQLLNAILDGEANKAAEIVSHHLAHLEEDMEDPSNGVSVLQRAFAGGF